MMVNSADFGTLADFLEWVRKAPPGTQLDAATVAQLLANLDSERVPEVVDVPREAPTWRERLWTVHEDTRLGTNELSEALGRPKSWVYAQTSDDAIPHRKVRGSLVFRAGDIRLWIRASEGDLHAV